MEIIPAIDLMNGNVVRLTQGNPNKSKVYFKDPMIIARRWQDEGADAIHIIDLDAALDRGNNLQEILKIVDVTNIPIQVGGGIRTLETAQHLLRRDVDRIIISTLAFRESQTVTTLLKDFGYERVVVALDHREGQVMIKGWRDPTRISVDEAMRTFLALGVKTFLITSITKDGTLKGPDYETLIEACNHLDTKIIASGGVNSLNNLTTLKQIGIWGVIIGKALYEGVFKLPEALEMVKNGVH